MLEIIATLQLLLEQSKRFNEHLLIFIRAVEKNPAPMDAILEFIARSNLFNHQIYQAITMALEDIERSSQ